MWGDRCFPQGLTHGLGKWFLATTLRVNLDLASGFVAGVKSYMVNPSSHVPT